ncbi:MAG TPA: hypothetical protein VFQ55_13995 [Casimicrobiaceae bacterium]|nr:hypothetical protein [Casimicrobiaceae bacterium]
MIRLRAPLRLAAATLFSAASASAGAAALVDCAFKGNGDPVSRGFYVANYDGATLSTVTLGHAAPVAGDRTIVLTARLYAYNGGVLGVASVTRTIGPAMSASVFDFGQIPLIPGATIAFTQTVVAGDAAVTYDRGDGDCPGVKQTLDTTPPLSEDVRDGVGVVINGSPADIGIATTLSCPLDPLAAGDATTRGFYVDGYGGVKIETVSLFHRATTNGQRRIRLTARLGTFDGPVIASVSVQRQLTSTRSESVFDLGGVDVPAGSTVTFVQEILSGEPDVTHDAGFGPCPGVTQTNGSAAPLDTFRRASVGVKIVGRTARTDPITVVEYFHAGFGHYFTTADPDEIAGLDAGAYGGAFVRTGQTFRARDGPAAGAVPVCRFFTVAFAPKSSHFYTADPVECAGLKSNPAWQYEKIAFYIGIPRVQTCLGGTLPVLRLYNDGMTGAPNHRFTESSAIYDDFVANRGWTPEGVRFCAPL